MTTVKGFSKIKRIAALLSSALLLLTGCSAAVNEELPFIPLGEEVEQVSEYRVIISRSASGEVIDKAEALCDGIEAQTGVATLMFYDDETLLYREDSCEIIIGETSRTVSRVLLRGMRRDDYICATEGTRTVIGGRSDKIGRAHV